MNPSTWLSALQNTLASIRSLPAGAHLVPVLLLICGLVLWLVGGRFLKQHFIMIGIGAGAGLAAMFGAQLLPAEVGPIPGPYAAMGIGAILGLIASLLAFRFSMALCGAIVLAAAGSLGMGVYLSREPDALPLTQATEARDRLSPAAGQLGEKVRDAAEDYEKSRETPPAAKPDETAKPSTPKLGEVTDATREFAQEVRSEAEELWTTTPERSRMLLIAAAAAGALSGAAAGMAMPKRAAAVVTAVLGAGLTLIAATWFAHAYDIPGARLLSERGPLGMLLAWAGMSGFGAVVQLRSGRKPSPPPPSPKNEAKEGKAA